MELIERRRTMMSAPHIKKDEGEILTFDTNFAKPLKMCQVGIEPVQDLHGQENAYPAGGGRNLLPFGSLEAIKSMNTAGTWDGNKYERNGITFTVMTDNGGNLLGIKADGTASAAASIQVKGVSQFTLPAGSYKFYGVREKSGGYDLNLRKLGETTDVVQKGSIASLNYAEDTTIGSVYLWVNANKTLSNVYVYPMICLASDANPTVFSPYSNICPIEGWTGAKVQRAGKNQFFRDGEIGSSYIASDGVMHRNYSGWITSDYIPVIPNTLYSFKPNSTLGSSAKNWFYTANKIGISYINSGPSAFTTPSDCAYMRFSYRDSSHDIQLELGSTATDYEPYQGEIYDITFPTETGTVYGGTLDMLTGELIIDSEIREITGITGSEDKYAFKKAGGLGSTTRSAEVLCNCLAVRSTGRLADMPDNSIMLYRSSARGYDAFGFKINGTPAGNTATERAASVNAELNKLNQAGTPLTVVFYLTEPIRYQLTPQQITALKGINNIWADTGETRVAYYGH